MFPLLQLHHYLQVVGKLIIVQYLPFCNFVDPQELRRIRHTAIASKRIRTITATAAGTSRYSGRTSAFNGLNLLL